jgi:anti-sigma-K factor RskA
MYRDHNFQAKLKAYLSGTLSEQDREGFEAELEANTEAQEEVAFSQDLNDLLAQRETDEVKALIRQAIDLEGFPPVPETPTTTGSSWGLGKVAGLLAGLAAALVLTWGVVTYVGRGDNAPTYVNDYLTPLENVIVLPAQGAASALQDGITAYDKGDYAQAASLLATHFNQTRELNVGLYYGTALLFDGKAKEAIKVLESARQSIDEPVRQSAEWYLALAYLKTSDTARAYNILNSIKSDHLYAQQAHSLMEQMNDER